MNERMIIQALLQKGILLLNKSEIESASLDSQIILSNVLGKTKEYLLRHREENISNSDEKKYFSFINRRKKREPIAYIIEKKEFFGIELYVNSNVLIPRPDTEVLVQETLNISHKLDVSDSIFIDVGTGSGAIALAIAKHIPHANIIATDDSLSALDVVKKNISRLEVRNVSLIASDLLDRLPAFSEKTIVVLANLPYIPTKEIETLSIEIKEYEPLSALDGGEDGLRFYKKLFQQAAKKFYNKDVYVIFECDPTQIKKIKKLLQYTFLHPSIRIFKDIAGKERGGVVKIITNYE